MVKINRIYTRTGDDGSTALVGGRRTKKTSRRVCAYGDIDELNAYLGACRTVAERSNHANVTDRLKTVQNELFDLGSELATATGDEWHGMVRTQEGHVTRLEEWIDEYTDQIPELRSFVLPGGTELNALLHIARTVCRRAERSILILKEEDDVSETIVRYINRLSDLLFALARWESHQSGTPEYLWQPGAPAPSGS
jgi:cob(I)alamin adenosyltransferase